MNIQNIIAPALAFARNPRVQRTAIGFVVGAGVGYAIAKTAEPFLFPEEDFEMLPSYETTAIDQPVVWSNHDLELVNPIDKVAPLKKTNKTVVKYATPVKGKDSTVPETAKVNTPEKKKPAAVVPAEETPISRLSDRHTMTGGVRGSSATSIDDDGEEEEG